MPDFSFEIIVEKTSDRQVFGVLNYQIQWTAVAPLLLSDILKNKADVE